MTELKYEKSCGAIVLRRDRLDPKRLFLLVIRQYKGGPVSFPKGHVEEGETEMQTAEREVYEETGVLISIKDSFRETIRYSPTRGVEKDVVYFLAYTNRRELRARKGEIAETFWVDVRRARSLLEHENDRYVLSRALEYIENEEGAMV